MNKIMTIRLDKTLIYVYFASKTRKYKSDNKQSINYCLNYIYKCLNDNAEYEQVKLMINKRYGFI